MASVGECDESLPLDSRPVRELRAVFECLGGEAAHLGPNPMDMVLKSRGMVPKGGAGGAAGAKVVRTEKVGSGGYCSLVNVSTMTCHAIYIASRPVLLTYSLTCFIYICDGLLYMSYIYGTYNM